MSERYWVSGVQLGILLTADSLTIKQRNQMIQEIIENQFIGNKHEIRKLLKQMEKMK